MRPFLLLATRSDDAVADAEYRAFLRLGGLRESQLERVRLESAPMPAIELSRYSAIIMGGGPFNASDPSEQKSDVQKRVEEETAALLDRVVARDFPFLGACYGIGTLGLHEGGVVDRRFGEEAGAVRIRLTDAGRVDPLFAGVPDDFDAFVGHKEACSTLPPGAVLLASSQLCPVQAFRVRDNLYATQFHPELELDDFVERVHIYRNEGYFPADAVEQTIALARRAPAVTWPGRVLANFVDRYARSE
jgi:GMP synthase (glutamine-hydrolysing)